MQKRDVAQGILRGLRHRCPNCGEGRLYGRYLKVSPECASCGHALGRYPADDAPPYFTILVVGHLVIGPLLFFPWIWQANPVLVSAIVLPLLAALTLFLLPAIKGGVVGLMWGVGHSRDDEPIRP